MKNEQETFDRLLAKAMKMIYSEGTTEKIAATISQGDPIAGIKGVTDSVVNKMTEGAKASGSQIPVKMLPDLLLAVASQVGDVAQAAGSEVTDESILSAFQGSITDRTKESFKEGSRTPEETQGAIDRIGQRQQQASADALVTPERKQLVEKAGVGLLDKEAIPTMTERLAGGLL